MKVLNFLQWEENEFHKLREELAVCFYNIDINLYYFDYYIENEIVKMK